MISLVGIIGLLILIYMRPQEFFEAIRDFNPLYFFFALSVGGIAYDVSRRRARLMSTPALRYVLGFLVWCLVTVLWRKPGMVGTVATLIVVCTIFYLILAHGVQTLAAFSKCVMVIFALGLFVATIGFDQGLRPFQCVVVNPESNSTRAYPTGLECHVVDADGAPHDGVADCLTVGQAGIPYACERAGFFETTSVGGGRVRYLGVLLDPNDLALATALALPFAFALVEIRRSLMRVLLLLASIVVVVGEIVFTGSRGGQLTLATVMGAYFVKQYGWKRGALVAATMGIPIAIYGGRSDDSADESTMERLGCACAGIKMVMSNPIAGVGFSQYLEHHGQTAHNSYVLAAGELGVPGMWLFALILFLSLKIPLTVLRVEMVESHESRVIKAYAMALLAAMSGATIGIFFLSWTYHYVLWLHFGLSGALYTIVKRTYPAYECRVSRKEALGVLGGYVFYLVFWARYIMWKGAWD
jgi:hypothetical protein